MHVRQSHFQVGSSFFTGLGSSVQHEQLSYCSFEDVHIGLSYVKSFCTVSSTIQAFVTCVAESSLQNIIGMRRPYLPP